MSQLKCDGVFEGGGVKGIGFVGALAELEKSGYTFENVAGTSAGAIVAALLAVGYNASEIEDALFALDMQKLQQNRFGLLGSLADLFTQYGLYRSSPFSQWLDGLLRAKNRTVFGDIRNRYAKENYQYRFQAIASDLTDQRMLVLPGDLAYFGIEPDDFPIAEAVRMSISLPLYFTPYRLTDKQGRVHLIVDGGILSNYPVWLLDDGTSNPPWPTFGFRFLSGRRAECTQSTKTLLGYGKSIISTMLEAYDNAHISVSRGDAARSILIPTTIRIEKTERQIGTTDFNITEEEKRHLLSNGLAAAQAFLRSWDFTKWKMKYRGGNK